MKKPRADEKARLLRKRDRQRRRVRAAEAKDVRRKRKAFNTIMDRFIAEHMHLNHVHADAMHEAMRAAGLVFPLATGPVRYPRWSAECAGVPV